MKSVPLDDLLYVAERTHSLKILLRGAKVLITGGSGFFGKWLLQSLMYLNTTCNLQLTVYVVSRDPKHFLKEYSFFSEYQDLHFIKGDVTNVDAMKVLSSYQFTHIIHAASAADARLNRDHPVTMFNTIVQGTHAILTMAAMTSPKPQILYISSGAIYGQQIGVQKLREALDVNLPKTEDAYALGKRAAEGLCSLYHREHQLSIKIARCFAFVGPYLPLDIHFAIGNFIRDALSGQSIIIKGSGRNVFRSYQYPTDLVIWLLHIMLQGEEGAAYNVGADEAYSILEVAEIVAHACASNLKVEVLGNINNVGVQQHYIPDIEKAKNAFNFGQNVSLEIAIQKTLQWYQAQ